MKKGNKNVSEVLEVSRVSGTNNLLEEWKNRGLTFYGECMNCELNRTLSQISKLTCGSLRNFSLSHRRDRIKMNRSLEDRRNSYLYVIDKNCEGQSAPTHDWKVPSDYPYRF